jgi:hypothetical protein
MFCPRCGQQAAREVRFCSRCGLALDAAAEIVEAGGNPEWYLSKSAAGRELTPRQKGTRKGLLLTAGGLVGFAIALLLTTFKEDLFVFLIPAGLVFVIGVMRMLYGLLLEDGGADRKRAALRGGAQPESGAKLPREKGRAPELPPAHSTPVNAYARADTSDMAAPSSVTEATTTLLEEADGGGGSARRASRKTGE